LAQIEAHYGLGEEVIKLEELKKQSVMDEEFENAAMYKK